MITPWDDINQTLQTMNLFRNRMNTIFNDFDQFSNFNQSWLVGETLPRTSLCDTGDNLELFAEVPGIAKEDINLKIQGNYLEIRATRKTKVPDGYFAHRVERENLSLSRSFTLPSDINTNRVEASLKDGILRIVMPKSEAAKPKKISIG